jgi:1,4-alpha-glucan branching enzyme
MPASDGIAVISDAVRSHAHPEFAYTLVCETSGRPNPMMGPFADEFSDTAGTDFSREITCDFFLPASQCWLHEYYVDGFRYNVPGILTVSPAAAKADLAYAHTAHQTTGPLPTL